MAFIIATLARSAEWRRVLAGADAPTALSPAYLWDEDGALPGHFRRTYNRRTARGGRDQTRGDDVGNVPQDTDAAALFERMARQNLGEAMWGQIVDEALACRSSKEATLLGANHYGQAVTNLDLWDVVFRAVAGKCGETVEQGDKGRQPTYMDGR